MADEVRRDLTLEEARWVAQRALDETGEPGQMVVRDDRTREFEFGWVFRAVSRAYLETGDPGRHVPGVGPIAVDRDRGTAEFLPTYMPPDRAIANYLEQWRRRSEGAP